MTFDLIIEGGLVYDGTGAKPSRSDVGITADRIEAVGDLSGCETGAVIDAWGVAVCPGFINIHSHEDLFVIRPDFEDVCEPYLRQGITTAVISNCGWSPAPWVGDNSDLLRQLLVSMGVSKDIEPQWRSQADFQSHLQSLPPPLNLVPLAAHGPIRIAVMGGENRFATPAEIEKMKRLVRDAMEAGCRGFSTGLTYFPGVYSHTNEIVELARVSGKYGGRYATHVRGHSDTYDESVGEAIEIAERAACSLQLSHVFTVPYLGALSTPLYYAVGLIEALNRAIPLPGWPNPILKKAMDRVDDALGHGVDIGMDFIPYTLGNTTVTQLFPPWANLGGTTELLQRLKDPATKARMRADLETIRPQWPLWEENSWPDNYVKSLGWRMFNILSVASEKNQNMEGHSIPELAKQAGKDPFDFLADLTLEEEGSVTFTFGLPARPWTEKVLTRAQVHTLLSVGADTIWPLAGNPPPSAYGCFPRVLGHYVRELGMYSLGDGIRRCTGLPASSFNLDDRGVIKKGAFADIVVFNPDTVEEKGTIDDPRQYPEGIIHVVLNGEVVIEGGTYKQGKLSGRVLTA